MLNVHEADCFINRINPTLSAYTSNNMSLLPWLDILLACI